MAEGEDKILETGDTRLDTDIPHGGARIPGTPGFESEAAYRHRDMPDSDLPEVRSNQLAPGPLMERDESPEMQPTQIKWNQKTRHDSR